MELDSACAKKLATKTDMTKDPLECSAAVVRGMVTRLRNQVRADKVERDELKWAMTTICKATTKYNNKTMVAARQAAKPKTRVIGTSPHVKMGRVTKLSKLPAVMTTDGNATPLQ
eukprot:6087729-Pyramimonas_sp.AAC.1